LQALNNLLTSHPDQLPPNLLLKSKADSYCYDISIKGPGISSILWCLSC
jgi:hypothetical protein